MSQFYLARVSSYMMAITEKIKSDFLENSLREIRKKIISLCRK